MEDSTIRAVILPQYRAGLAMLRHAIELCSQDLWTSAAYYNRFWHVAYHAAFYTHLYVQHSEASFHPWAKHVPESQYLGPRPGAPKEASVACDPYPKADVLNYLEFCWNEVESKVPELRFEDPSGFHWLPFSKLELQFYNIRHLQHHTGQLADRVRAATGTGVGWVR